MASEVAEAGLIVPMTWLMICRGHMQSFNLLALKLWICINNKHLDRQLLRFEVYIVRFVFRGEGNVYYGVGKLDVMMEGLRGVVAVALDAVTDLDAVVTNHVGGVVVEDLTMRIKLLRQLM